MKNLFLTMCIGLLLAGTLNADILLTIDEVDTPAGTNNVTLAVSISDPTGMDTLLAYNIPIDVGTTNDNTLPVGLSNLASVSSFPGSFDNFSSTNVPAIFNYNSINSDSGAPITLSAAPTELFQISLDVAPGLTVGQLFDVVFQTNPEVGGSEMDNIFLLSFGSGSFTGADLVASGDLEIQSGEIEIIGDSIPEPMSTIPMLVGALVVGARRSRR